MVMNNNGVLDFGGGSMISLRSDNALVLKSGNSKDGVVVHPNNQFYVSTLALLGPNNAGKNVRITANGYGSIFHIGETHNFYNMGTLDQCLGILNAASYNVTSSIRYKENVQNLTEEEAKKILDLRPVTFNYKKQKEESRGLIAEETDCVIPEIVVHTENGKCESINYIELIPYLIKMIQIQQEQIDHLLK